MNTGSPSNENLWDMYVSPPLADDSDRSLRDATSNKDLDEILGLPPANQDIPLCKRCTDKTCKRRLNRAKNKGKKQVSLDAVAEQFP
jgi:hypothetical protein